MKLNELYIIKGLHYYIMAIEFFVVSDKLLSDKNLEKRDKNITKHNNCILLIDVAL